MDKEGPPRYDRERPVTWLLAFLTYCASMGGASVTQSATKGNAIIALSDMFRRGYVDVVHWGRG